MEKVALITGASGEIGGAMARTFARAGYFVLLHYAQNKSAAQELCRLLAENGCRAQAIQADLAVPGAARQLVQRALEAAGRIDLLVNNAGAALVRPLLDTEDAQGERILQLDLTAAIQCARYAAEDMLRRQDGVIINIASVWGLSGAACEVYYSAAKAGLIGFTKAMAAEFAPSRIRVNAIAPGVIDSPMNSQLSQEERQELQRSIPAGRFGNGYDIAKAALFLASPEASYITGQTLNISGGFLI